MGSLVEQEPVGTQLTTSDTVFEWRRDRFKEMGFSKGEAEALANSKIVSVTTSRRGQRVEWMAPLHWGQVKAALEKGCSHSQALQIFVDVEGL